MHLAVRTDRLYDAQDGYLTIDRHGNVGLQILILD
jgi:hypothetical protein